MKNEMQLADSRDPTLLVTWRLPEIGCAPVVAMHKIVGILVRCDQNKAYSTSAETSRNPGPINACTIYLIRLL